MRRGFCERCYTRDGCGPEPCDIVKKELRSKGVYDMDPHTNALTHKVNGKQREVGLIFLYDPYTDSMMGLIDPDDESRSVINDSI